jgi:lipoprotein-anchoring transpeptidase ErfK/SrfK
MCRVPRRLVLVVLVTLTFVSCSSPGGPPAHTRDAEITTTATGGSAMGSTSTTSASPGVRTILPTDGTYVAMPLHRYVTMWEVPGEGKDPDFALDTRNDLGELVPMLVTHATMRDGHPWYEVLLPIRPNGRTAWVPSSDVKIREREDRLDVDLSKRLLVHYHGDEVVDRFKVGIGTDVYPTTTGQFYVYVKVPYDDPNQPYGIMALGLSGFSRVITDWPGGGRIAVHGTPSASDRGQAVSHGCVRVYNPDMQRLTDLPLGTPVEIHD